eukprot:1100402-Rhodomonas_salina.1
MPVLHLLLPPPRKGRGSGIIDRIEFGSRFRRQGLRYRDPVSPVLYVSTRTLAAPYNASV